eukprot:Platyproteum_vivax@DN13179_c0_g1_i1.p1
MSGIMEYNGSAIVAMAGENCVGIACDTRLGSNRLQTVATNFPKTFKMTNRCYLGLGGLATDVLTVHNQLRFRMNLYALREEREMKAQVVSNLVSSMLYGRRFAPWFVSPVVAGLDENDKPLLSAFDFIGAPTSAHDFVVTGTASEQLYGVCESFWKPKMDEDELFETLSQCLLAAIDRDTVSGWGAEVDIITPTKIVHRTIKTRTD